MGDSVPARCHGPTLPCHPLITYRLDRGYWRMYTDSSSSNNGKSQPNEHCIVGISRWVWGWGGSRRTPLCPPTASSSPVWSQADWSDRGMQSPRILVPDGGPSTSG